MQVELQGWKTAAEINEKTLREAQDDYNVAISQYQALLHNPTYHKHKASDLWAQFFERRAAHAAQRQELGDALLWWLKALAVAPNDERARAVGEAIDVYRTQQEVIAHSPNSGAATPSSIINMVALSPDGRRVLTGSDDDTARLWHAGTATLGYADAGQPLGQPMRHDDLVIALTFSPDGCTVLTCSADGAARLWQGDTGQLLGQPMWHERLVWVVAFSPDGRMVLTGSDDGTARLWQANSGRPLSRPKVMLHNAWVSAIAFSPDGRIALTGSADGTVRLWHTDFVRPLGRSIQHNDGVLAVSVSPNGRSVLSATASWIHVARLSGDKIQPVASHPLPGVWKWGSKFHFPEASTDQVHVIVGTADASIRVMTLYFDPRNAKPVQGEPATLLEEWQRRLGRRINEAGEIVPLS